jgi:inner membrane protein
VLIGGSLLPDADGVLSFAGTATYLVHHRGFTHSLAGWLPTALAVAIPAWWMGGKRDFGPLLGLALVAVAGHVFLDALNAWGVAPFYPFGFRRWQLDWVFILDLVFTGCCLVAGAGGKLRKSPAIARAGLCTLAAWIAFCATAHAVALHRVDTLARERGWTVIRRAAVPNPPFPTRWGGLVRTPEGIQQIWLVLPGTILSEKRWPDPITSDVRRQLEASPDGRAFLVFARYPVAVEEGDRLVLMDAPFRLAPGWPDRRPFALVVEKGRVFFEKDP